MTPPQIKHVIFDWAGTLYDDHYPSYLATEIVIKKLSGQSVSFDEYKEHFTLPVLPFYRRYNIQLSIDEINDFYFAHYAEFYKNGKLFSGVWECLNLLRERGITLSVHSTLKQELLTELCHIENIAEYFLHIEGSVCDKRIELAGHLTKINVAPEHVLFIGDTDHDIHAGQVNQVQSGGVLGGYHDKARLAKANPKYLWADQQAMLAFFIRA